MGIPWGQVLGSGAAIATAYINKKSVENQNRANREEAQKNRDFQADQSSTTYQRGTEDMRLAGINPLLAYSQGGASSPGGSLAAKQESVLGPAVSSAMHLMRFSKEMKFLDAQTFKVDKDAAEVVGRTNYVRTQNANLTYSPGTGLPSHSASMVRLQRELVQAQLNALRYSPILSKLYGTEPLRRLRRYRLRPNFSINRADGRIYE